MIKEISKFGLVLLGFSVILLLSMNNVSAAWWNLLPCEDECFLGQLKCRPDEGSAYQCGDYDTIFDFDHCLEFPPDGTQNPVMTCPFGCFVREAPTTDEPIGDICLTSDPCVDIGGETCNPGDTRCGRKCKEGTSCVTPGEFIDASYLCKKITVGGTTFDCYGWSFEDQNAQECPFGCDWGSDEFPGSGMCLDANQRDLSTCVPSITKCSESNTHVIECVDDNFDGVYNFQTNPLDWQLCPNGCAVDFNIDGMAYCKDEDGATDCNQCLFGGTRCNPNNIQYMQWCWESDLFGCSSWTNDYTRFVEQFGFGWNSEYGQYCDFGCHLGKCRPNPEPDVPSIDACPFVGSTRCSGDGSYQAFCLQDPFTGDLVWGNEKKCLSGKCVAGACVKPTGKGYETLTQGIPTNLEIIATFGMATDGRYLYISSFGRPEGGPGFVGILLVMDSNSTYRSHCFLNETGAGGFGGITVIGQDIYVQDNSTHIIKTDAGCNDKGVISLDRNISGAGGFISSNETHFFIEGNTTDGLNVYNLTGNYQYSICMIDYTLTFCSFNHRDAVLTGEKLYILNDGLIDDSAGGLEIYGLDGYYFGNDTIQIPEGYTVEDALGITSIGDKLYILWAKVVEAQPAPQGFFVTDYLISVYFLDRACKNTCNEGGSHCVGAYSGYVSKCIELTDGCFKYFDEVGHLFPAGTADDYQENCGATQCKEYWQNHYILKAFCDDDSTCEDVCELGEFGCDPQSDSKYSGSRYKTKCILKDSPLLFNLGRKCFGWADPFDAVDDPTNYELCDSDKVCVNGNCVPAPSDCSLDETHCETKGSLSYVVPCLNISGSLTWSFPNATLCSQWGCFESFNTSGINKRFATCNNATIGQITASRQRNALAEFESWWLILWPDAASQLFIILILSVAAFVLLMPAGWQLATGGGLIIFIGHLATGWLGSVFLFAILLLLGILILPKYINNGGDD